MRGEYFSFFVDEFLPRWVREQYPPPRGTRPDHATLDDDWSEDEHQYYLGTVKELSDYLIDSIKNLETSPRPSIPNYFNVPQFRAAYLLYFLPLNILKLMSTFYEVGIDEEIRNQDGVIRFTDLASGPGTASIALLLYLCENRIKFNKTVVTLVDKNSQIIKDGREILENLVPILPEPGFRIDRRVLIKQEINPWWKLESRSMTKESLVVLANSIYEERSLPDEAIRRLSRMVAYNQGLGTMIMEPAFRSMSQRLSEIRDLVVEDRNAHPTASMPANTIGFWGPCLHNEPCPLKSGAQWCWFNTDPELAMSTRWYQWFVEPFEHHQIWERYSYAWFSSGVKKAPKVDPDSRRVVLEPSVRTVGEPQIYGLCEPGEIIEHVMPPGARLKRGAIVNVGDESEIEGE